MASASPTAGPPDGINAVAPLAPNAWLRYDVVERMLPAGVTDVLEIGCGRGSLGARLAQRYHYLGVEPDRASWEAGPAADPRGRPRRGPQHNLRRARYRTI